MTDNWRMFALATGKPQGKPFTRIDETIHQDMTNALQRLHDENQLLRARLAETERDNRILHRRAAAWEGAWEHRIGDLDVPLGARWTETPTVTRALHRVGAGRLCTGQARTHVLVGSHSFAWYIPLVGCTGCFVCCEVKIRADHALLDECECDRHESEECMVCDGWTTPLCPYANLAAAQFALLYMHEADVVSEIEEEILLPFAPSATR